MMSLEGVGEGGGERDEFEEEGVKTVRKKKL